MNTSKETVSIEQVGLKTHLDASYKDKGGYIEFVKRMQLKEPKTVIARAFGVDRRSISKWIRFYQKEVE